VASTRYSGERSGHIEAYPAGRARNDREVAGVMNPAGVQRRRSVLPRSAQESANGDKIAEAFLGSGGKICGIDSRGRLPGRSRLISNLYGNPPRGARANDPTTPESNPFFTEGAASGSRVPIAGKCSAAQAELVHVNRVTRGQLTASPVRASDADEIIEDRTDILRSVGRIKRQGWRKSGNPGRAAPCSVNYDYSQDYSAGEAQWHL
jgi:hypothetical protein